MAAGRLVNTPYWRDGGGFVGDFAGFGALWNRSVWNEYLCYGYNGQHDWRIHHVWSNGECFAGIDGGVFLDNLQQVEVRLPGKSFLMRSQLCGDALPALRAAGAALPPTIQEVE